MTNLVLVGESWGEHEERLRAPFVGPAGQELSRILSNAGYGNELIPYNFSSPVRMLNYWSRFPYPLLNVFSAHPPENDIEFFYTKPSSTPSPFLPRRFDSILYLRPEYEHHVVSLHETLKRLKPNVIIALGNTALWALGLPPAVSKLRGSVIESSFGKVLPTYHPASVLRKWEHRIITVLDLHKALRESKFPEIKTLSREIWTQPSISDLYSWWELYGSTAPLLAFDIETILNRQISEIAFAADSTHALHVPFFFKENRRYISFWPDAKTEFAAWKFVKMVCESPVPKIGQNCIQYDAYWLSHVMRIGVKNIIHDTMQLAHAFQPEMEKSLGFLGSIFLDEIAWKGIRKETTKQND